ncbi:DUF2332 domain-containing protein [Pelagerythrobacter marensis]|nr:DUF2332 domain-containing protein [Pelagerythrobacter marensis]
MADRDDMKYEPGDPAARGPEAVRRAFANQVAYCRSNGAEVTASVCEGLHDLLDSGRGGAAMRRIRKWQGAPLADALPLRIAGGLHALHLDGAEPDLEPVYAGQRASRMADLLADVIERHEPFLMPWLDGPPQTNEAGRSAGFAAAFLWLVDRGLPGNFALNEIGASAGINLMMRRYRYDLGGVHVGPAGARMRIAPEWRGDPPPSGAFDIVGAQGCDIAPVDLTDERQASRLRAYIWPEYTERFARLDAAIVAARTFPPEIERCPAADFVERTLATEPEAGVTRVIMHSVVWQYLPEEERERIEAAMAAAGARASAESPLAWVALEANRDTHRHELSVRYWPGGETWTRLAVAHPHGAWIEWEPGGAG